jgi:urease accessory protein
MDRTRTAVRSLIDGDARATGEVGRQARLEIEFARRDGRTRLVREYAEPPFRVGRAFADGDNGAHLIVASSAPGIFGGDRLTQTVAVGGGTRVRLTSQSALQVHPASDGRTAELTSHYHVAAGAHLSCEWDPSIPFPAARLNQRIDIDLDEQATLFWSDAIMSGREARGERWLFGSIGHELRLVRGGCLAYLERYVVDPRRDRVDATWAAADACYLGTVLAVSPVMTREVAEALHDELTPMSDARASTDLLEETILLVRLMARTGPAFHAARASVAARLQPLMVG